MKIVSFDLSLRRTGFADGGSVGTFVTDDVGMKRLLRIKNWVLRMSFKADLVVLEGYAHHAQSSSILSLAELGGVVRLALYEADQLYVEVPPTVLKKYATGSGNANKQHVMSQAWQKLEYRGHDDNEADALWLRTMALDHYGLFDANKLIPKAQRSVLEKINWPTIPENTPGEDTAVAHVQQIRSVFDAVEAQAV